MTKADSERAIRSLAHDWANETGAVYAPPIYPSVSAFMSWMKANRYGGYLEFRTTTSVEMDIELWLEDELKAIRR